MAGTKITVETQYLSDAENKIRELKEEFKSSYEIIYKIADELTWSGVDSSRFRQQLDGFRDDLDDLYEKMGDYSNFLSKAASAYCVSQSATKKRASLLSTDR